ncbi:MAG: GntR family transcriptional regulator [Thermoguttaceae bacterium]
MFIQIDFTSSVAIYEQIAQQIKFAVAADSIRANELIPSVRELSKQLAINPNTISRAFRALQDEGIVYSRRGTGLAVAVDAQEKCKVERKQWFETCFKKLFDDAVQSGLPRNEIIEIVKTLNPGS